MRRPLIAFTIATTALLAACSSSAPAWTYAPPTEAPPSQPAASDSGEPTAVPVPSDGGNASGAIQIGALNIAYTVDEVNAPADAAFVIEFDNQDSGVPHDIEIKDSQGDVKFQGDIVTGPAKVDYQVPALAAGDYQFVCTVHPNMIGNLHVGG